MAPTERPLRHRIVVVGFGRFGRVHALRLGGHPAFELAGVVDPCEHARTEAAARGLVALASIDQIPTDVDAAAVVTPAHTHAEVAVALLYRGLHVLVEKPLATHEGEITQLLEAASRCNRLLTTGHIERFNVGLSSVPWSRVPSRLRFCRQSTARGDGRSVVLDLMVHDIDLAAHLLGLPGQVPFRVVAVTESSDGVTAQVQLGSFAVELCARHGAETSLATLAWDGPDAGEMRLSGPQRGDEEDAMTRQYNAFHQRLTGRPAHLADGHAGALAARRALAILAAL
jgi:predicted dehydrogenase